MAELECKIGQQALEIDFLKRCLQRIDEQRELQAVTGKPLSVSSSALGPTGWRIDKAAFSSFNQMRTTMSVSRAVARMASNATRAPGPHQACPAEISSLC